MYNFVYIQLKKKNDSKFLERGSDNKYCVYFSNYYFEKIYRKQPDGNIFSIRSDGQ